MKVLAPTRSAPGRVDSTQSGSSLGFPSAQEELHADWCARPKLRACPALTLILALLLAERPCALSSLSLWLRP